MSGKKIFPLANRFWGKIVVRNKIFCRASSVLAGQLWQTPPELKGLVSPLTPEINTRMFYDRY
jgi:hypothetical protein